MDTKVKVRIENLDRTIEAEVGQDLRSALLENDIDIYTGIHTVINCRGKGLCGTCQVEVIDGPGLTDKTFYEAARLKIQAKEPRKTRLACLTRCYQDTTIRTMVTPALVD